MAPGEALLVKTSILTLTTSVNYARLGAWYDYNSICADRPASSDEPPIRFNWVSVTIDGRVLWE